MLGVLAFTQRTRATATHPADVRFAITGVYNPDVDEVSLHEMYGQPFGAGHSVPNFCRVAEWISRCSVRLFHTFSDHFFDDFFCLEPSPTIESSLFCLKALFTELGFQLDLFVDKRTSYLLWPAGSMSTGRPVP